MKDHQDQKDQQVSLAPLAPKDNRVLLVILVRGVLLVRLVYLEQMVFQDLQEPLSCFLSALDRALERKDLLPLHRKPKLKPFCLKLGLP